MIQTLRNKKIFFVIAALLSVFVVSYFMVDFVSAQDPKSVACDTIGNLTGDNACDETGENAGPEAVGSIGKTIVDTLSALAAAVAVIFLVVGGIRYMTSAGNPDKIKAAKGTITAALIGLAIVLLTQFIINVTVDFTDQVVEGGPDTPPPAGGGNQVQ